MKHFPNLKEWSLFVMVAVIGIWILIATGREYGEHDRHSDDILKILSGVPPPASWFLGIYAVLMFAVLRVLGAVSWGLSRTFLGRNNLDKIEVETDEENLYSIATKEASGGGRKEGLWGKCFVDADGDETKTKVLYIKRRVEQMEKSLEEFTSQEEEVPLTHYWKRIVFAAVGLGWLLSVYKYDGRSIHYDEAAIFGGAIGRALGLMTGAWLLAGLPWLFYKLTRNPLSKRGYIITFIVGLMMTLVANLIVKT